MARALAIAAAVLTVGAMMTACGTSENDAAETAHAGRSIDWGHCRSGVAPEIRCGTMQLPVDWRRPDDEQYTATVYRQPAKGHRRGTVLTFPSGPGTTADASFSGLAKIATGYDIVGIDARGVAATSPLRCSSDALSAAPLVTPGDAADFARTAVARTALFGTCATAPSNLIKHLDAYSDARDAEAFRVALGSPKPLVEGFSYGTLLATRYLELYGDTAVGAVLDGVMKPGEKLPDFVRAQTQSMQQIFDRFAAWCATDDGCPIDGRDASRAYADARRNGRDGLIPGVDAGGRPWGEPEVVQAFEQPASGDDFAEAARVLAALAARQDPVASAPRPTGDVGYPRAIACSDFDLGIRDALTARTVDDDAARGNADVPYSVDAQAYTVACAGAARPAAAAARPARFGGTFDVLMLSHRYDALTPITWANQVAADLGPRAKHIVVDKVGHGASMTELVAEATVRSYFAKAAR